MTEFSWRWVFLLNLPLGIIAVIFGALFLERAEAIDTGKLDVRGSCWAGQDSGCSCTGCRRGR